jgi:hypothetical protein
VTLNHAAVLRSRAPVSCCVQGLAQIDLRGCEETPETVIHRFLKVLFASQVSFSGQHRNMSKEELDLFQLSAIHVAKFRASPA